MKNFLYLLICLCALLLLSPFPVLSEDQQMHSASETMEQQWGIKFLSIRPTAAGHMLDFRYHVSDAEKASPLFTRQIKPYLIEQGSGARLMVAEGQKVGSLRQTRKPEAGRNYFIIFGNPGKYVKKGHKVSVVIGPLILKDLVVE